MKITLQNLTKKFPSRNKKVREDVIAVNDFNFEIPDISTYEFSDNSAFLYEYNDFISRFIKDYYSINIRIPHQINGICLKISDFV